MTRSFTRYFLSFLLLFLSSFSLHATAERWKIDPQHTYVLWKINHLGFSTQVGKIYASGTMLLDPENPKNSNVIATLKIAEITTGIAELDKHLQGQLFFDAKKFPTATFASNKVELINKTTAKIQGTLTMHGVSKLISLNVTMNKTQKNPINDKMTMGLTATTEIKRSDFGMTNLLPNIGDEVTIEIGVEANKDKS